LKCYCQMMGPLDTVNKWSARGAWNSALIIYCGSVNVFIVCLSGASLVRGCVVLFLFLPLPPCPVTVSLDSQDQLVKLVFGKVKLDHVEFFISSLSKFAR